MKRCLLLVSLFAIMVCSLMAEQKMTKVFNHRTKQWVTFPELSVTQIEQANADSLLAADAIQNSNTARAYLQASPYVDDTVLVTGLVAVPPFIVNYTADGWTCVLYDTTGNPFPWGGIFVRVNSPSDSATALAAFFANIEKGDIVQFVAIIQEFPALGSATPTMNSTTQLLPWFGPTPGVPDYPVSIIGSKAIAPPVHKEASDFYQGLYQGGGTVQYSTGEPYENMIVEMTNLTYIATIFTGPGREVFLMVDEFGNQITTYDCSRWFTTRGPDPTTGYVFRDPASTYSTPIPGSHIDTIRGFMFTAAGEQNNRGYRMCPVYPGDIVIGNVGPSLSTHRRNPVIVTAAAGPDVAAKVTVGTFGLDYVRLYYRINHGPLSFLSMAYSGTDSLYHATLPIEPLGTFVNYFIKTQDTTGVGAMLASGHPTLGQDTSAGTFFYNVTSGSLSIYDIQYTPFISGYSGYIGSQVLISGTVTADTAHLLKTALTGFGTNTWYIQSGNSPWNGIWIQVAESLMADIVNGDSIAVRGTVGEGTSANSIVTRLYNVDSVAVLATGKTVPSPVTKTTGTFSYGVTANGSPTAEPYEGMLLRFTNLTVTSIYPYFSDPTEYDVNDGSGPLRVRQDGLNSYSNIPTDTALGKSILVVGEKIDTLIGVLYYSANTWVLDPRTNDDFKMGHRYNYLNRWNMVSVPRKVLDYTKTAIYPNPPAVSAAYSYSGSYVPENTLKNGVGYWLKFSGNQTIRYSGSRILQDTIEVDPGWNMIGSITDSVATSSIVQVPASNVKSPYYTYSGGYSTSPYIRGGVGYWVKVDNAGQLIIGSGSFFKAAETDELKLQTLNSITITDRNQNTQTLYFGTAKDEKMQVDNYVMPPTAPVGGFDARFSSNRMAELYPVDLKSSQDYLVKMANPAYPLTVSWAIVEDDANKNYSLTSVESDKNTKTKQLVSMGAMTIKSAKNDILTLSVGNSGLPKEFTLSNNYPNPFNPSTKFTIAVPQTAKIELVVYDILGRKVKTLLNEEKTAGYHTVEWSGLSEFNTPVATGVYFVRMNSEKFSAVRKIMMMK